MPEIIIFYWRFILKRTIIIPLILIAVSAAAITLGAAVKYDSAPEYSLGSSLLIDGEIADEIRSENKMAVSSAAADKKISGYRLSAKSICGISGSSLFCSFDMGNDSNFTFSLGVPSDDCLIFIPDGSSVKSVNSDAGIVIAGIDAYFADSALTDSEVLFGTFDSKNNYSADLYIYSTEATVLSGSYSSEECLSVYNVKLLKGWNRVLKVKKDRMLLITNGENENGKWAVLGNNVNLTYTNS